jgi:hypothetical protein
MNIENKIAKARVAKIKAEIKELDERFELAKPLFDILLNEKEKINSL